MSNSENMTLEERIVQKLKDDTLMSLVGDEDAILELAKRAINEALFKDRQRPDPNNSYRSLHDPSPVVTAAGNAADRVAEKVMAEILDSAEVKTAIHEYIIKSLPNVLLVALRESLSGIASSEAYRATEELISTLRQNGVSV